jgi:shikimate kinase
MRIYLLGFMGAGKTTLGSRVAAQLHVPFLDTDKMIEEQEGESITSIFSSRGEDAFRVMEARILRETEAYDKALIATGGGLPMYHLNMPWLQDHGITMYLELPDDVLLASIVHFRKDRPLFSGLTDEEFIPFTIQMMKERRPVYEQASMTLSFTGDHETDVKILERACKYIW